MFKLSLFLGLFLSLQAMASDYLIFGNTSGTSFVEWDQNLYLEGNHLLAFRDLLVEAKKLDADVTLDLLDDEILITKVDGMQIHIAFQPAQIHADFLSE